MNDENKSTQNKKLKTIVDFVSIFVKLIGFGFGAYFIIRGITYEITDWMIEPLVKAFLFIFGIILIGLTFLVDSILNKFFGDSTK